MTQPKPTSTHNLSTNNQDEVVTLLKSIDSKADATLQRVEALDASVSKRAAKIGAMAGALSGGLSGTVFSLGIELIKAKFGG